ncbi:MAG: hypothetical protein ACREKJ_08790 [Candidatus Rokuibacteriota bacterium]
MRRAIPLLVAALLLTGPALVPVAALEVGQKAPDWTLPGPGASRSSCRT